jgi:hypothetical protein
MRSPRFVEGARSDNHVRADCVRKENPDNRSSLCEAMQRMADHTKYSTLIAVQYSTCAYRQAPLIHSYPLRRSQIEARDEPNI